MWVCPQCHKFNEGSSVTCLECNSSRPHDETPKGRKEHRHASYIKDKKTMYTHPGPFGWKLAKQNADDCGIDTNIERQIHSCRDDYKIVAVLDIGMCYSGYGYSTKCDPTRTNCCMSRIPTCLLISPDKKFLGFGNEAIQKYAELERVGKHTDCYFFQNFKTDLSENEEISMDMMISDITGKTLEAKHVFGYTILALKKCLFQLLDRDGQRVTADDIRWVIPVPTLWNDAAKQFTRKLADVVGIPEDQLLLSLEPEAASLTCQQEHLPPETQYMVVSLGGGITDIIVHETTKDNNVKELVCSRGGNFGGNSVDLKFLKMLEIILGEKVLSEFKKNFPTSYINLLREFESAKKLVSAGEGCKISVNIPREQLESKCKEIYDRNLLSAIKSSQFSSAITLYENKLEIDPKLMRGLFKYTINETILAMKEVFEDPVTSRVSRIVLVGGGADSSIIQNEMRSAFPDKTLIVSEDASSLAVKGSFVYGHQPAVIQSRVMKYSYGVGISDDFDPEKHDKAHFIVRSDGTKLAIHIFDVIISKNQHVASGTVIESEYLTIEKNQKTMEFELYFSTNDNPQYIDEIGSRSLGSIILTFPEVSKDERNVKVSFIIGNTEIKLTAIDKVSRQKISVDFDLV